VQLILRQKLVKELKSVEGLLESERLMKEKLRKENTAVYLAKETTEADLARKLKDAEFANRMMDEDILLLQRSNEETEALLKVTAPEIHDLKLRLIEANNTIARYKAQLLARERAV
jgi:actin-related protein